MSAKKGCINKSCVANKKKTIYKSSDTYCSKCGDKLYFACKKCFTKLPNDKSKLCVRCQAEKEDKKDAGGKKALKIGAAGLGLFGTAKLLYDAVKKK